MLREGGLTQPDPLIDLADRQFSRLQMTEDQQPVFIGQRLEQANRLARLSLHVIDLHPSVLHQTLCRP